MTQLLELVDGDCSVVEWLLMEVIVRGMIGGSDRVRWETGGADGVHPLSADVSFLTANALSHTTRDRNGDELGNGKVGSE